MKISSLIYSITGLLIISAIIYTELSGMDHNPDPSSSSSSSGYSSASDSSSASGRGNNSSSDGSVPTSWTYSSGK